MTPEDETPPPSAPLSTRFREVRRTTESLCAPLSAEDAVLQSMDDASPAKWHLAHTSWFFETFLLEAGSSSYRAFHPDFRVLFNSYYNSVGEQHPRAERGLLSRPSLHDVLQYRAHVTAQVLDLIAEDRLGPLSEVLELGLHHEQQHQELIFTDVKHLLSRNPLRPAYDGCPTPAAGDAKPLEWIDHPGGVCWIGHEGSSFAFDNEAPRHRVFLEPFELASRPVTAGEYLAFITDGGYERSELWLSDGWNAVRRNSWCAPLYWEQRDGSWLVFTLAGLRELRAEDPLCHVSYYEADAFARWAGARLPSEAEWEVAAAALPVAGSFADSGLLHPSAARGGGSGLVQLFGDVWEWTRSSYVAYPGFAPTLGALGEYNGKFMANQMVLRGGSCVSPPGHLRATYRNFFYPEARWQFSGIRLARDAS